MYAFREHALAVVRDHQVTILCGETGCGKSTQMPSFILEEELSNEIGSYHIDFNFDTVVTALTNLFTVVTNFQPKFKVHGGSRAENQALQNIQARLRMVLSYLFASLLPTVRQRPGGGGLLVLASSNVDGESYPNSPQSSYANDM